MAWTCPACGRPFGTVNRPHDCAPGLSEDEYFATGHERERLVYDVVRPALDAIADDLGDGDLIVEFVSVGVFFKRRRNFAELRPMQKWVALSFVLPRSVDDARITRRMPASRTTATTYHVMRAYGPDDVDDVVRGWLAEAYVAAAPARSARPAR